MTWLRRILFAGLLLLAASPMLLPAQRPNAAVSVPTASNPQGAKVPATTKLADWERSNDSLAPNTVRQSDQLPERFVVEITGRDFRWHFRIKEPAELATADNNNILMLPAGIPITWELTSEDYIYVLRVPELGINMMAVPDLTSTSTSEHPAATAVDLLVDPLCGFRFYHDEWMGRVELTHSDQATRLQ